MNDQEIREILKDPKKLLDLIRAVHRMLHIYDTHEVLSQKNKPNEKIGLNDNLDIQLIKSNSNKLQEVKQ